MRVGDRAGSAALAPAAAGWSRRRWLRTGVAAGGAVLLAGCELFGPRRPYVLHQGIWRGRISIHTEEERSESYIASFYLRGSAAQGALEVYNPLGSIMARLEWNERLAHLRAGSQEYADASLDNLVRDVFGTPIPVRALFAWLSGDAVEEDGWQVDLSRYGRGRIDAVRQQPLPVARMRIVLQSGDGEEEVL
ncbi:outer membrane lipoprotein LolB [Corticibacter populi]|uniref:Outer-membrane lipoprotein LolB n=1 Tax=Corticibacter populi TaxID=1550736 RepID=A0A3M6QU28_9BURK|nr:lipoprotein insertase outer membrane protein LolB [Corticibacter populi]RMX06381.1 outer membrane lipoprotein LolB [Corticibacter populi]RZS32073.1 outer membrane lipoprotein LolB [Corticibacter populi]